MENMAALISQHWLVECYGKDGKLKWVEDYDNLVVTEGLNKYLDATLKTGLASPAWYVGLKDTGTPAAGDTLASHATWVELDVYSETTRRTWTPGTISGGSVNNSSSKAVFTIDTDDTVYGAFMCSVASGTAGVLLGVGDFAAPRAVISGDVLNVTVTCSIAAS